MSKKVLLINDMAGYGKVALSAMIPVLSYIKYEVFNLPTALVSNTLDYGKFDILETTDYMRNSIRIWEELSFSFDAVSTGFIVSEEQTRLIIEFCKKKASEGTFIFSDPIMGDDGKLYPGVAESTVNLMRQLISVADYIVPNYTEAAYLADIPYKQRGASLEEFHFMIDKLRALGAKSVVITSAMEETSGTKTVVGYDHKTQEYFHIDFEEVPVRFPGTGDIFSSVLMGKILDGASLFTATQKAMDVVKTMIIDNAGNADKYKGIPLEKYLEVLEMKKPKIQITLIDRKGPMGCHRGHKIGDTFDFDTERGNLCPMAMHVAFPYVDILRYGGEIPGQEKGTAVFACPDVDTLNVFKIERLES